jgi:pyridoxine 5-phosphate synthase
LYFWFEKMINLSVNINKIATLRNARGGNNPNLVQMAIDIQSFGAQGITVHPRPDERHIKYEDVRNLKPVVDKEFNIEGYPNPKFLKLIREIKPDQVTLVPDGPESITSSYGWNTKSNLNFLTEIIIQLHDIGVRTSIFVDPDTEMVKYASETGCDRIELYTEPYAANFVKGNMLLIDKYVECSLLANKLKMGVNAGHDLDIKNIEFFSSKMPFLDEVSIGHALICESLYMGIENVINIYIDKLNR